ncbi:hypothetical protein [Pseudomonas caspiana]|uniref:Uncharacterized protein n=1 Tax=Pseudomonas caspiana TaxID=1451454 RepID=A0A1Y3NXA4_9PSED|nr:hypothetical protein [Pseudomonas caspiana]OUM70821.1 hypothetical protein AUC60_26585 [Pseudomonas caspiana]
MTTEQIYALIGIIIPVGLLFWFGYMMGRSEGLTLGLKTGEDIPREQDLTTIKELEASLQLLCDDHQRLAKHCKSLKQSLALGLKEKEALLDIAEKLRIAAETFSAFRTGKKLHRDCLSLREQALEMAALLQATEQEQAA